jgi:TPP-dependent pyruvate/acetoin dehydrogenase alpha subunit
VCDRCLAPREIVVDRPIAAPELVALTQLDPIERLRAWMAANRELSEAEAAAIETGVASEIDAAVAFAEAGSLEPLDDLERFVLMDEVVQERAA